MHMYSYDVCTSLGAHNLFKGILFRGRTLFYKTLQLVYCFWTLNPSWTITNVTTTTICSTVRLSWRGWAGQPIKKEDSSR
jgi:hypothetical protein